MIPAEKKTYIRKWLSIIFFIVLFLILISNMQIWEFLLKRLFPQEIEFVYPRANLLILIREHLLLTLVSSSLAIIFGLIVGIFVTRPAGREYLSVVNDLASLAQTFPPVAVLALAVPFIGFGFQPTIIALFLYSILPIIRNTISGLKSVSESMVEAARGMGMNSWQVLYKVELPLALKVIMAGIRISVVINVGTATLGAVVGAGGLGTPIISGLVRDNPAFVMEGALAAAFLAILLDQIIALFETNFYEQDFE